MRRKILSSLHYIIFLGAGLLLVWWQLREMTTGEKTEFNIAFKNADYLILVPVIVMNLLSHFTRAVRWRLLMKPLGYFPKLKNVFGATMVGYLANAAVPRLGEVLKCTMLAKQEDLKTDKLIGTVLIERTFDFCTYLLFIVITVFIQLDVVGSYVNEKLQLLTSGGKVPLGIKIFFVLCVLAAMILIIKKIFSLYPDNAVLNKIRSFISGIFEGFSAIKNLKERKTFLVLTAFMWTLYLMQIFIGFKAMDGTAHLGIKAACAVLSLSTLAMIVTPGGIGAFPFFVMETLLIYGISSPQGKAFGWLMWGVSTLIFITAGLLSLVLFLYLNKKKNAVSSGSA